LEARSASRPPPHPSPPPCLLQVIIPKNVANQCCGMMFNSRGFKDAAAAKGADLQVGAVGGGAQGVGLY